MLQSKLLTKTQKGTPKAAETASHKLLVQGDFIDQLGAGIFSMLPLGWRVHKKIEGIIRDEMNNTLGAQELSLPAMQPKRLWEETGRWDTIDPPLFKFEDRHGKELTIAPTHEEVITDIVRRRVSSYKELPFGLYQIQVKFRNEMRSSGGLLRTREFIMKDLYSFHTSLDDLQAYYERVRDAYINIYTRCGLNARAVKADSGSIGGDNSHEFMILAEVGEDTILACDSCGYAVNTEVTGDKDMDCPQDKAHGTLRRRRSIEAGHIFQLEHNYSGKMKANFTDKDGKEHPIYMGCYGIGVGRLMATVVEASHDEHGIIWPKSIAPFYVHLIGLSGAEKESMNLYDELRGAGIDVLYDDRDKSAGEKFSDADLIGIPKRIVISPKTLEQNSVELKNRANDDAEMVKRDQIVAMLTK